LQKAAVGLIGAACLQVGVALAVARSGYPGWFLVCFPGFIALTAIGIRYFLYSKSPASWVMALCGLFAIFSLSATWAIRWHYTGALNVAEPLIGLGGFGAGMSASKLARSAAAGLIVVHRGALMLAGTGHLGEHLVLALIECASFCAAVVGSTVVRGIGGLLNGEADRTRGDAARAASAEAENQARRERPRMVHDAPVHLLSVAGHGGASDSPEFRRACAQGAGWLRGQVNLTEPAWTLAEALDDLVLDHRRRGLHVYLTHGDLAAYPRELLVVGRLARAVHQCLVNVALHSEQQDAWVSVVAVPGRISIEVRDHGRGFIRKPGTGFGSRMSIEQRMQDIGGYALIESEVGAGTTVTLVWPGTAPREVAPSGCLTRLRQWARTCRWSRQQARQRCASLSAFMWRGLPRGLAVFAVLNAAQLAIGWPSYRHGLVVVALLAALIAMFLLVWRRSPGGIGLLISGLAIIAGPVACLAIATQLNEIALTGPANWVSGFCVVPICLLPFARPVEEMGLGIASLAVVQGYVMAGAGRSLRDLHTIVMSGGAGVAIGIGIVFLVEVIRQMDTVNQDLKREDLDVIRLRIVRADSRASLKLKLTNTESGAAELLDALADGTVDVADLVVQQSCAQFAEDLKRELRSLESQSLLLAELLPDTGDLRWVIGDEFNLSQRFVYEDRILLVRGLRSILARVPEGVSVKVLELADDSAGVTVASERAELPATPEWRAICRRFAVRTRSGSASGTSAAAPSGKRWIYQWDMPVTPFPWEAL
jgi:hypothetical protein